MRLSIDIPKIPEEEKSELIVLDQNLFGVPITELDQVKVLLTLFEGRATYNDPEL